MVEDANRTRTYDEKAVTAILKRASQLQARSRDDGGFGLSLAELKQVAAEAGIDPRFVSIAASEFIHPAEPESNWWGGPLSCSLDWTIDGEIDDVAWEEIVAEARRHFKDTGEVRAWSNSREWAHSGQNNIQAHVTATSREGITRLNLFWAEPTLAVAAYIPLLVLSLILLPIIFESLALTGITAAATWFTAVGLLFLLARWFMGYLSSGKKLDLSELRERLQRIAADSAMPVTLSQTVSEAPSTESLLDTDTAEPLPDETGQRPRRRERN